MPSPVLEISEEDRATLTSWTRSRTLPAGRAQRARIVLAVAAGTGTSAVARHVGVSRPTVIKWRDRFAVDGLAGLEDEERSGRPKSIDDAVIIATTLEPPPAKLGVTHWSSRLLGRHLGIGDATVARAWRKYGVKPWRRETFKFSTDPQLEAKVREGRREAEAAFGNADYATAKQKADKVQQESAAIRADVARAAHKAGRPRA